MLFLLKCRWQDSLGALIVLVFLALCLRQLLHLWFVAFPNFWGGPRLDNSWHAALAAVAVFALVICSDGIIHFTLLLGWGTSYRVRFRELAGLFRKQKYGDMLAGAVMAGLGEELLFRGISLEPAVLVATSILFGLLHHVRRRLWPFTLWSIYQGLLFAVVVYLTGNLFITMVAHFLHDFCGFVVFHWSTKNVSSAGETIC
jgi:membrane protease YdiL (CAAX protease family)